MLEQVCWVAPATMSVVLVLGFVVLGVGIRNLRGYDLHLPNLTPRLVFVSSVVALLGAWTWTSWRGYPFPPYPALRPSPIGCTPSSWWDAAWGHGREHTVFGLWLLGCGTSFLLGFIASDRMEA